MTRKLLIGVLLGFVLASTAGAARLPGVRTPSGNIGCFVVPMRPTTRSNLLCNIEVASYTRALQAKCIAPPTGLDWHGFMLPDTKRAEIVCAGGIMYDARDKPTYVTLPYGRTWRRGPYTCHSRRTGLTCTNRAGHGLFLSRESWRTW